MELCASESCPIFQVHSQGSFSVFKARSDFCDDNIILSESRIAILDVGIGSNLQVLYSPIFGNCCHENKADKFMVLLIGSGRIDFADFGYSQIFSRSRLKKLRKAL
jgi:hypothetical protein